MRRETKVGALLLAAVAVAAFGIFLVGEENSIFRRKARYFVRFSNVAGLAEGNPVQLNGVTVGDVDSVVLPTSFEEEQLTVWIRIDRRYQDRVRVDSIARIKTVGLLGDKYIEITSGSPEAAQVPIEGEVTAAPATDVDKLLDSGADVANNIVAISFSLKTILGRMEAGEGILGELTKDSEAGREAKESIVTALAAFRDVSEGVAAGQGTLGRLIRDDSFAAELETAVRRFSQAAEKLDTGEGALPLLLNDAATGADVKQSIANLARASEDLAALSESFQGGDGLLVKLLQDQEYGDELTRDLQRILDNLSTITGRIESGDGSLGALVNDPDVYQAVDDIIVGVNESKMLRWLIRNRQKKGIEKRYDEQQEAGGESAQP